MRNHVHILLNTQNDVFAKTGSGQKHRENDKKKAFCAG